jgi:urea transporter
LESCRGVVALLAARDYARATRPWRTGLYHFGGVRRRILITFALLAFAIVVVPIVVLAGGEANPGSSGVSRIERTFAGRVWD